MKLNQLKEDKQSSREPLGFWLADDDEAVRNLVADVLTRKGTLHCSRQFSCAEDLLHALRQETPPEVIVLDINMGEMSGIDAIPPIKSIACGINVFVMTTFYDSVNETRAISAGASGFFMKTDCHDKTIACIEKALEHSGHDHHHSRAGRETLKQDCVTALRVSSPGRLNHPANESSGALTGRPSRPPLLARTLSLFRSFIV